MVVELDQSCAAGHRVQTNISLEGTLERDVGLHEKTILPSSTFRFTTRRTGMELAHFGRTSDLSDRQSADLTLTRGV